MIRTLLFLVAWVIVAGGVLFAAVALIGAWGSLTFHELPPFSEGPEPTNVVVKPIIDLPLGPQLPILDLPITEPEVERYHAELAAGDYWRELERVMGHGDA